MADFSAAAEPARHTPMQTAASATKRCMPIERSRQRFDLIVPAKCGKPRNGVAMRHVRLGTPGASRVASKHVGSALTERTAMRTTAILLLGALALVACQKDNKANDRTGST